MYKKEIGIDLIKYRHHVYRVFLNCRLMDTDEANEEKYAIAAFFHDIGIWTDHAIDYLVPSIEQAAAYLLQHQKSEWLEEIKEMIYWHHKTGAYGEENYKTVEIFRKADWIDVSLGFLNYGVDKSNIKANRTMFPNAGFHWFLVKKIAANFFRHPLRPLPMFKT